VCAREVTERIEDWPDRRRRAPRVLEAEAAPQRRREHEVVERCATTEDQLVAEQRIRGHREGARGHELVAALSSRAARRDVRRLDAGRSVPLPQVLADVVTLDHQTVSDLCSHGVLPSPAGQGISVGPGVRAGARGADDATRAVVRGDGSGGATAAG
jgi:hypothetical protein